MEPGVCAAVPGGWGARGWTSFYFVGADDELVRQSMEPHGAMSRREASSPRTAVTDGDGAAHLWIRKVAAALCAVP